MGLEGTHRGPGREAALLEDVAARGVALGLDPAATRAFFAAQIEAAKLVQRADLARWQADGRDPTERRPTWPASCAPDRCPEPGPPRRDGRGQGAPATGAEAARRIRDRADAILAGDGIDAAVRAASIRPLLPPGD